MKGKAVFHERLWRFRLRKFNCAVDVSKRFLRYSLFLLYWALWFQLVEERNLPHVFVATFGCSRGHSHSQNNHATYVPSFCNLLRSLDSSLLFHWHPLKDTDIRPQPPVFYVPKTSSNPEAPREIFDELILSAKKWWIFCRDFCRCLE